MTYNEINKYFLSLYKKLLDVRYELKITANEFKALNSVNALITRQQAKIEKSKANNKAIMQTIAGVRTEAVKEFAEKVLLYIPNIEGDTTIKCVEEAIKQTLKETVGEYGQ